MSTKPFKKVIKDEMEDSGTTVKTVKPFKVDSKEDIDTSEIIESIEDSVDHNTASITQSTNFFSTFNGIVAALFIFIFIAVIADTVNALSSILTDGTIASYIYLFGIVFLLGVLILNTLAMKQENLNLVWTKRNNWCRL